jgi:hypothetical protein
LGFAALGWKYYLIWGTSSACIPPVVFFFYPETAGMSVEQIDTMFIQSPSVLKTVSYAASFRRAVVLEQDTEMVDSGSKVPDAEVVENV